MKRVPSTPLPAPEKAGLALRLAQFLARAGFGSRRACEDLVTGGRVTVNGRTVLHPALRVVPGEDRVEVDGRSLQLPGLVTVLLHKPAGTVSTASEGEKRPRVLDLVAGVPGAGRLFSVGRLDQDAEGLLLLTNDGDLAFRLTHPRFGVEKVYRARVRGHPSPGALQKVQGGVRLEDGPARGQARLVQSFADGTAEVEIRVREGRKRLVKRMLKAVGHPVILLRRIRLGPLSLGDLPRGRWRLLTRDEVGRLRRCAKGLEGNNIDNLEAQV